MMNNDSDVSTSADQVALKGKIPPFNLEAEKSLLGAICVDSHAIHAVLEVGLHPEDFYWEAHQQLFEAMLHLTTKGLPIDIISLSDCLRNRKVYQQIGGAEFIGSLFLEHFAVASVEYYAKVIRDKSILRKILRATREIAIDALSGVEDVESFIDETEKKIYAVSDSKMVSNFASLNQIILSNFKLLDSFSKNGPRAAGLMTGFSDFDQLTCGLMPGQLVIIAARPAMGKTSFVLSSIQSIAKDFNRVITVFSLEMAKEELAFRFLSGVSQVPSKKLKTGLFHEGEMKKLTLAADFLYKTKIFIDDSSSPSILDIRSRCRRLLAQEKRLDLVVVDYLQLMKGSRHSSKEGSREREISEISRGLKNLAKELKTPIIAISQLNRGVETRPNKRPMLSDLRECVTADTLVMLASGEHVAISKLEGLQPFLQSYDVQKKQKVLAHADKVWCVGQKETLKFTLSNHRIMKVSLQHRLYQQGKWVFAEDLKAGDCIQGLYEGKLEDISILDIQNMGLQVVYDLTVPQTACWISDGILHHNSGAIEQDADLVCFIYRDEVYNKETQDKGIAELIVAKHRAGETATIRLKWLAEYTLFANIASRHDTYQNPTSGMNVVPMHPHKGDDLF